MAVCEICSKKTKFGNQLSITRSHISKRTSKQVKPNLRHVKIDDNGTIKKVYICAKCLKNEKNNIKRI